MTFRSSTQPYCRYCGKPIAKQTVTHRFGVNPQFLHSYTWSIDHAEKPATKVDVQRMCNGQILRFKNHPAGYVEEATLWDGETYKAQHFDTLRCGDAFGQMAAGLYPTLETQDAYNARIARCAN